MFEKKQVNLTVLFLGFNTKVCVYLIQYFCL